MYSSESRRTPSDMGILTSATTSYDVVAARALPGAIGANTSEQSSRTVEPRARMSSPPQGRVAVNGPATLGDLQGRENSVASSFRPTVAGILGESSWYALRLQTVRPAWRVGQRGGQRAGSHLHCDVVNVGS